MKLGYISYASCFRANTIRFSKQKKDNKRFHVKQKKKVKMVLAVGKTNIFIIKCMANTPAAHVIEYIIVC